MLSSSACPLPRLLLLTSALLVASGQALGQNEQRPADEAALFRSFAAIRGLSASYSEEKYLSLLAVPLKSSGKLHYLAKTAGRSVGDPEGGASSGHLARIVEAPEPSQLTVSEQELRMARKDRVEVIDLRQSDRVRLFVTSLLHVFQGDRDALLEHYRVRYTQDAVDSRAWQLELVPLGEPLNRILQKLVLSGRGKAVARIELHEPNGDRTVTTIVEVDGKRTFSDEEQRDIFGIAPKAESKPKADSKAEPGAVQPDKAK